MAKIGFFRVLMSGTLLACVLLITPYTFADSYARIVRLSDVEGSVDIDRNTGQGFEKALLNMPITQGVRLKTGLTGRAEVEFEKGSVIRMVGDSSVDFTQLSLRSSGDRISEIQVDDGTVYVDYRHKGADDFRVDIGNRGFDLTKDVRFRIRVDRGEAEVAVFKGELNVPAGPQSAKVKKNETFTLDLNDGAKYTLAKGISTLPTDDYNLQRTQYVDQYANNRNYGSPYSYGYSDLNRYGSFFDAPGYGLVWQPASMGMGWDPYSNGYWSLYPGQGYVWVSSYPWGWTPYRYGQWSFLSSYGWVWLPGGWNQWNTGIAVVNPPPTWRRPLPPAQGSGYTVPVGKPAPIPFRAIHTDDLNPGRLDRASPVAADGSVPVSQTPTGVQSKSMSSTPVVPSTPNVTPVNPSTIQTQPLQPKRPVIEPPVRMNRGLEVERPNRAQPIQPATPSAPSKSMAQPSAPPPAMQPSRPMSPPPSAPPARPAPVPRAAPSRSSSNNFQMRSAGGFHAAGPMPHASAASHSPHAR
jgi:hypothetical protein